MYVWSESKEEWERVEWTEEGKEILRQIHELARRLEEIENVGKKHAVIALIEELTSETVTKAYVEEKVGLLFR